MIISYKSHEMSASNQDKSIFVEVYDEKHCVEMMKLLNVDRKKAKSYCDGTLQAERKEYSVHKCIVGLLSEFLKSMFNIEMREKYEKVIKINNMTDVVLGNILDFIYSGFVRMTSDNVFDLLERAEYMQVDGLKNSCKSYLVKSTNVENCLKYRAFAQRYNLDEVCDASDRVIAEKFADVIQHEDFNELDSDAVSSLIDARKERINEEVVFSSIVRWVNHNAHQRQEFFVKLFSFVDLGALSQTFLDKHVLSEPLILSSMQCLQRLLDPSGPLKLVAKSSGSHPPAEAANQPKPLFKFGTKISQESVPKSTFSFGMRQTQEPAQRGIITASQPSAQANPGAQLLFQSPEQMNRENQELDAVEHTDTDNSAHNDTGPHFEPKASLPKVEVRTGEEDEDILFQKRCRLYKWDSDQWKERGVGKINLLRHPYTGKCRLVMRRDQVHKVCCNHFVTSSTALTPMQSSDRSMVWLAHDFSDEETKNEHFAARFKTAELAQRFKKAVDAEAAKASDASSEPATSEPNSEEKDLKNDKPAKTRVSDHVPSTQSSISAASSKFDMLKPSAVEKTESEPAFKFIKTRAGLDD